MNSRLQKMIDKGKIPNRGGVFIDTYNQSIHEEIAMTITTRVCTANHYYITEEMELIKVTNPLKGQSDNGWHFEQQVYDAEGITRAVKAGEGSGNIPKVIEPKIAQVGRGFNKGDCKEIAPTITSNSFECNNFVIGSMQKNAYKGTTDGVSPAITAACGMGGGQTPMVGNSYHIRKLTPRECFRLMGVDDADIDKIQASGISNSQQYKCAGNSIVVDVLYHLFRKMLVETENESEQMTLF